MVQENMKRGKIILTRPAEDARDFAFCAAEHYASLCVERFLYAPMLSIVPYEVELPPLHDGDAVILTSAHAVDVLLDNLCDLIGKDIRFFVVGNRCKDAVLQLLEGSFVVSASTISELLALLPQDISQRFLYLRGRDLSFPLVETLDEQGYAIDEIVCYEANMATLMPEACLSALRAGEVGSVAVFSKRSAQALCNVLRDVGMLDDLGDVTFLCIREHVADVIAAHVNGVCRVAKTPDRDGMLELLHSV